MNSSFYCARTIRPWMWSLPSDSFILIRKIRWNFGWIFIWPKNLFSVVPLLRNSWICMCPSNPQKEPRLPASPMALLMQLRRMSRATGLTSSRFHEAEEKARKRTPGIIARFRTLSVHSPPPCLRSFYWAMQPLILFAMVLAFRDALRRRPVTLFKKKNADLVKGILRVEPMRILFSVFFDDSLSFSMN